MGEEHLTFMLHCCRARGYRCLRCRVHHPRRRPLDGAGELLDVGGDLPLHPHFIDGVPRFSQHRASGSLAGLHIPLLLCDVDDADIHGHDSPAGSSAEKMDCNINVCGYVPSNRVFALFQFLCITSSSLRL
ncbi:hypothetical protein EPI10_029178 [Gossypium australe]|uniref:Uncharacterized protein n=1 Tax=Gossypium australe TaxID=47621 RepID=A0A5B6V0Q4_9ROSI|nr:hypothetical protein EPI10_029178 [Gossypium australe]